MIQRWFLIIWCSAVLVVGLLALREREQHQQQEKWDDFIEGLQW
jgi:hypothetical protein